MFFDDLMETYKINDDLSNRKTYDALLNQIMNDRVTPIIGAGLSCWADYPLWESLLREKAKGTTVQSEVDILLDAGQYEQAASKIERFYGRFAFLNSLRDVFSPDKINNEKRPSFQEKIPEIFKGPIVTTNFDVSLEKLLESPFVVTPENAFQSAEIESRIQKNERMLVKLHGDIQDPDHMILSNERYSEAYGSDENIPDTSLPLPNALKKIFVAAPPCFIGCGLNGDRTGTVMKACRGASGFAILELPEYTKNPSNPLKPIFEKDGRRIPELQDRLDYLDDMRIQVIWYPHGMHESVGVIIDQLYRDIQKLPKPVASNIRDEEKGAKNNRKNAFQSLLNRIKNPNHKSDPLSYDSNDIFISRDAEKNEITKFLNRRKKLLFWVICGPGGVGKTKLVYSCLCNNKRWDYHFIDSFSVEQFEKMDEWKCNKNTCLIFDDADLDGEPLLRWFSKLFSQEYQGDKKLRIILLARGEAGDDDPINGADWFKRFVDCSIPIKDYWHQQRFLLLSDFNRKESIQLAKDYIFIRKKRVMNDAEGILCNVIFQSEEENERIFRPLFVLVIIEQFVLQTHDSINEYNVAEIYERIYELNCKKWFAKIGNASLFGALKRVYAYVTIMGEWDRRSMRLPQFLEAEGNVLAEADLCSPRNNEYARWFRILSDGKNKGNVLKKLMPDLLGEYYVLRVLNELSPKNRQIWMRSLIRDKRMVSFFRRVISDFGKGLSTDELTMMSDSHSQLESSDLVLSTRQFIADILVMLIDIMRDETENEAVAELIDHYFNLFPFEMSKKLSVKVKEQKRFYCWVRVYIKHFLDIHENQTIDYIEKKYPEVMSLCSQWNMYEATDLARAAIDMLGNLLRFNIAKMSSENICLQSSVLNNYWSEYEKICSESDLDNMKIREGIIVSDSRILEVLKTTRKKNQDYTTVSAWMDAVTKQLEERLSSQIEYFTHGGLDIYNSEQNDKASFEKSYRDALVRLVESIGRIITLQVRSGLSSEPECSTRIGDLIRCIKSSSDEYVIKIGVSTLVAVAISISIDNSSSNSAAVKTIFSFIGSIWRSIDKKNKKDRKYQLFISHIDFAVDRFFSSERINDELRTKAFQAFEAT